MKVMLDIDLTLKRAILCVFVLGTKVDACV